ncbi:MAG: hypothetical protein ABR555_16770 [Pyrinomonadaceae bacterium]
MQTVRFVTLFLILLVTLAVCAYVSAIVASAQTLTTPVGPDVKKALSSTVHTTVSSRTGAYQPDVQAIARPARRAAVNSSSRAVARLRLKDADVSLASFIDPGTRLSRVLHTSQLNLSSPAGTDEEFVDQNENFFAEQRTTFDAAGGSFDIAVGQSGARYEVFSATLNNTLAGILVMALDTNADYIANSSSTFDLHRDFGLPSAAAVVSGTSKTGREFVIVSSSGYFNDANPNDPNNEPSPGIVLLVRDPITGGFDNARSHELVHVGDNKLFNANALALMPNNDLLIADFHSDELRIIRDTDNDGMPDTLDASPYYSYQFSDDAPLDVAVNARGVVFSHSAGNSALLLAIYDDNNDGRADHDEVAVTDLSIDNNLFLHGLTVDRRGNVYVIEDASASFDGQGGNGGTARIDVFPDPKLDGFLQDGFVFADADNSSLALTGIGFGPVSNQITDTEFFVIQQYLDFLSRQPDGPGLSFWTQNIDSCGADIQCREIKRIDTSAAFFLSIEFQRTGFLVYRLYKTSFPAKPERPRGLPRFTEFMQDTQQIGRGVIVGTTGWEQQLESNTVSFINSFVARPEFQSTYPAQLTAADYVDNLNTLAGNALSSTERNALVNALLTGQETRTTALRKIAEDVDFQNAEFNRAFVLMQYFGYLRRNPDAAPDSDFSGYDFWLGKLNQFGGDFRRAEMVKAFISSIEYNQRFN